MTVAKLRPSAKRDLASEVRHYRREGGSSVATRLRSAVEQGIQHLERNPGTGSPIRGQELGIVGLRTWRLDAFPVSIWYFERANFLDVVRLVGDRQDAALVAVDDG